MKKQTQARVFLGIIVAILAIIIIASLTSSREDVKNEGRIPTLPGTKEIIAASAATTTTIPITTFSTAPTPAPLPPPSTAPTPAPTNSS